MANGQEVFQKVLQIHIVFSENKSVRSNLRFIWEKGMGGGCRQFTVWWVSKKDQNHKAFQLRLALSKT